jgi:proteasome assembly chaperone (PAC2) family protein
MAGELHLKRPWLIAVWPGMGNVALNAGIYLLAKLGMSVVAEFEAGELFDIEQVEVKAGLIQVPRRPRNRFFVWHNPHGAHDLVVFLGEAQPPLGKYPLCKQIIEYARGLGVERVFTFAAMATRMHPRQPSRVFGAATDDAGVEELRRLELEIVEDGQIGGLNGVLLGAAAAVGLHGACMLGEMPHIFTQLPFPKASLAILEVFDTVAGLDLDMTELTEQSRVMEEQLGQLLERVEQEIGQQTVDEDGDEPEAASDEPADTAADQRIEELFARAVKDRSKAFELKQELDRLGRFKEFEDRFLDLFRKSERPAVEDKPGLEPQRGDGK